MFSPSTTPSSPLRPEASESPPPNNRGLISNTNNVANVVPQTPIRSSIVLSNLIPAVLLLIYALYMIYRIRNCQPFTQIKRFVLTHVFSQPNGKRRGWKGKRDKNDNGYVHIDANLNVIDLDDFVEHHDVEWDVLTSDNQDGHDTTTPTTPTITTTDEIEGRQRIDMKWERIDHGECRHSYPLVDILVSDPDTDSGMDLDHPLIDNDRGFDSDHNHEQMCQDDRRAQGYACNHLPTTQKPLAEFDMSKYFDPRTSRIRDNALLGDFEAEIGEDDEGENYGAKAKDGYVASWVHGSVNWVVARFINWLVD
ncbi:hypothetical protein ACJ72_01856 [Emergomyces africanus]|uniref:Uncharacterized protein n=1 Tax=Emergomyces africanus TaxID=1955775 RepID=A0A1B7P404_9EURO|nr:hypothetical protein ACJ72_01856 [Emergomyces africanus]